MSLTVALDAMGGDHGPAVVVPAAFKILSDVDDIQLILVGDEDALARVMREKGLTPGSRVSIRHASQQVEMDELPSQALRTKKDSSMRVAIDLVKEGTAHACVSAGNTGALMATARFVLKTLPGIDRPAIISALPAMDGHTRMLDLGANVEATPRQLFEFAVMGSVLTRAVDNVTRPRVGLLNIGQEEIKGNERVREAARLLAASDLHYIGFVEGDDIYKGTADVIVCDGFVGNVALKSSEGVAQMIAHYVGQEFNRNLFTRIAGLVALPVLRSLRRKIDPREYNGASLMGLRGIVIKSHGSTDAVGFANAIKEAHAEIQNNVPARINEHLESILAEREAV
ncbi:MAG: phosphate acyltransferase PlsX [Gammaproteobacteria bacterium]|nr:phosphate acyltransferase PlsX [Gammaproteobacteria bacterium]NIR85708.1 phosphate acyltransferase PlsX [Gammaproteobacteria bacterium]NIR90241.1 phosphate acyltransferase PlsX [Gammaproteobacteria bacterium]NIU06842.1 phosphate acyltransferase PlsX [Gammaproteobacteria bacterium]NIV53775.1 phosphate acyltransferase PlsX [Gammaproteobacteria bacterium]